MRPHPRKRAADDLHNVANRILKQMVESKRSHLTAADKKYFLRNLKRFRDDHKKGLGEKQKIVLEWLLEQAREAKTYSELLNIHSKTCTLGLEKF